MAVPVAAEKLRGTIERTQEPNKEQVSTAKLTLKADLLVRANKLTVKAPGAAIKVAFTDVAEVNFQTLAGQQRRRRLQKRGRSGQLGNTDARYHRVHRGILHGMPKGCCGAGREYRFSHRLVCRFRH